MKTQIYDFLLIALLLIISTFACEKRTPATGLKLDVYGDFELDAGETKTIAAVMLPYWATDKRQMKWTSSNYNIVNVQATDAIHALLTAVGGGTATITATTKDGQFSASCNVKVFNGEPDMIQVEGGTFIMGCFDGECHESGSEEPPHEVTLSSFKIAKYTVTVREWKHIMGTNPNYAGWSHDRFPVVNISWDMAQEFITKLNAATGKKYRLPTEAEWEFAARGGNKSQGYKYSGSNNPNAVAMFDQYYPWFVGSLEPNELGIYDMSGNVWEWCNDWFSAYPNEPQNNPTGSAMGDWRILRGGDYFNKSYYCRVTFRNLNYPQVVGINYGFRLVHP
jgi:formylglycine-generating enzyme required for sulfatase activity